METLPWRAARCRAARRVVAAEIMLRVDWESSAFVSVGDSKHESKEKELSRAVEGQNSLSKGIVLVSKECLRVRPLAVAALSTSAEPSLDLEGEV